MHVASLELSRELYELSGWDDRRAIQYYWHGDDLDHVTVVDAEQHEPECAVYPAYDLGYLLRKLPGSFNDKGNSYYFMLDRSIDDYEKGYSWAAAYMSLSSIRERLQQLAVTPEDAAAKLAIELFKQNILRKET